MEKEEEMNKYTALSDSETVTQHRQKHVLCLFRLHLLACSPPRHGQCVHLEEGMIKTPGSPVSSLKRAPPKLLIYAAQMASDHISLLSHRPSIKVISQCEW